MKYSSDLLVYSWMVRQETSSLEHLPVIFGVTKINDEEIVIRSAKSHTVTLTPLLVQPNS